MKRELKIGFISLLLIVIFTSIAAATPQFQVNLIYTVEEGDTLYDLGLEYGVSIDELREANNLEDGEYISYGDEIIIPREDSTSVIRQVSESEVEERISFYESQEKGWQRYNLEVEETYEINIRNKVADNIDVSHLDTLNYHVKPGDNLYELAREFNTRVAVIKKLNGLNSDMIRRGDRIKLPINNLTEREVVYHTMSDDEFELLARIIYGEARGEPYIGQVAVGAVVLNRVISSYFPDSIRAVVKQPNQFCPVSNGQINLTPDRTAYQAARDALHGKDPTRGARYFYNPAASSPRNVAWFEQREVIVRIGDHVFTH